MVVWRTVKARTRTIVVSVTAAALIGSVPAVAALATTKSVEGGTWTYAATGSLNYSYFLHPTKWHRSSVENCAGMYRSHDEPGRATSRVSESVCLTGNKAYYYVY